MVGPTPTIVELSPDELARLRAVRDSAEFFQLHLEELRAHRTPYVVLHRGTLVAAGKTQEGAWKLAKTTKAPISECVLVFVPKKGESYYF